MSDEYIRYSKMNKCNEGKPDLIVARKSGSAFIPPQLCPVRATGALPPLLPSEYQGEFHLFAANKPEALTARGDPSHLFAAFFANQNRPSSCQRAAGPGNNYLTCCRTQPIRLVHGFTQEIFSCSFQHAALKAWEHSGSVDSVTWSGVRDASAQTC